MLKSEAKLATLMRRIVGTSARVVLGYPPLSSDEKGFTKPHIYLRFNHFVMQQPKLLVVFMLVAGLPPNAN